MNATLLIVIIVILVCIAVLAFLLLKRRSRKRRKDGIYPPLLQLIGGSREDVVRDSIKIDKREEERLAYERHEEERRRREAEAELKARQESFREKYRISIAHPKLLSKRYSSRFLVQLYLPEMRSKVSRTLAREFGKQEIAELVRDSELETGQRIQIRLSSPDIVFSDPIIKKLDKAVNITNFIAKPTDDCEPGVHQVVLSLSDAETQVEYCSISFTVKVTDFAFDHVSRPFLSKATSAVLGLGSLIMFLLTGLEQVDKTFGLTAGTAAAVLTSTILIRWWSLFQQPKVTQSVIKNEHLG